MRSLDVSDPTAVPGADGSNGVGDTGLGTDAGRATDPDRRVTDGERSAPGELSHPSPESGHGTGDGPDGPTLPGPADSRSGFDPDTERARPSLSVRPPGPTRVENADAPSGRTGGPARGESPASHAVLAGSRPGAPAGPSVAHPSDAGGGGPTLVVAPAGGSESDSTTDAGIAHSAVSGRPGPNRRASDASAGQDSPTASRDPTAPDRSTADDRASREGRATARTLLNDDGTVDERVFDRIYEKLTRTLERDRRLEGR